MNILWSKVFFWGGGSHMLALSLYFAWYDLWVGVYLDWWKRITYIQLIPTLGIRLVYRVGRKVG